MNYLSHLRIMHDGRSRFLDIEIKSKSRYCETLDWYYICCMIRLSNMFVLLDRQLSWQIIVRNFFHINMCFISPLYNKRNIWKVVVSVCMCKFIIRVVLWWRYQCCNIHYEIVRFTSITLDRKDLRLRVHKIYTFSE